MTEPDRTQLPPIGSVWGHPQKSETWMRIIANEDGVVAGEGFGINGDTRPLMVCISDFWALAERTGVVQIIPQQPEGGAS